MCICTITVNNAKIIPLKITFQLHSIVHNCIEFKISPCGDHITSRLGSKGAHYFDLSKHPYHVNPKVMTVINWSAKQKGEINNQ